MPKKTVNNKATKTKATIKAKPNSPKKTERPNEVVSELILRDGAGAVFDTNLKTMEKVSDTPGGGIPIGTQHIPIPKLPKRYAMRGKKGTVGPPSHKPTPEMRQYVFDCMVAGGTQAGTAHNLRISAQTLAKHYEYELEQAEGMKDAAVDGVLLRNVFRSETDKNYQTSVGLYLNRHGKLKSKMDITSGGEKLAVTVVVPAVGGLERPDADIPDDD